MSLEAQTNFEDLNYAERIIIIILTRNMSINNVSDYDDLKYILFLSSNIFQISNP